jgi:ketosteroid isomerase-like protein
VRPANVELVKRANAALNRGDIEAVLDLYVPDAELRDLQSAPDQPLRVRGLDAIREVWIEWASAFDHLRAEAEEFIEAGDTVVVATRWRGEGKESGVAIDNVQYDLFDFEEARGRQGRPRKPVES